MERFKVAHASGTDWEALARSCADQLGLAPAPGGLGFLYVSDPLAHALPAIHDTLRRRSGIEHWVGTIGLGVCAAGQEYFDEPAIVALTAALPPSSFRVFGMAPEGSDALASEHEAWSREVGAHFGVVHGDPREPRLAALVADLAEATDGFLVGGLTSSRAVFSQIADRIDEGGLSGVLFSDEVAVATALTQSCSPLGNVHEVTACEANVAIALDGRPAFEVFKEDIGEVLAREPARVAGTIFAALPVRGSDSGDYLVRNLVGLDPTGGLVAIGERLQAGDRILFVRRDREGAEKDLVRMLEGLKRRTNRPPAGGLYYSCLARGPNLFGVGSAELGTIREVLGDFPLVGFFGNGEISHDRLYTYTGVLTLFL